MNDNTPDRRMESESIRFARDIREFDLGEIGECAKQRMGREFVGGYRDRLYAWLEERVRLQQGAEVKQLVPGLGLDATEEGNGAAGTKVAASEGEVV